MSATNDHLQRLKDLSPEKRAIFFQKMARKQSAADPSAHTIPRRASRDSAPLSFAQQRLWFIDQLMPGTALYNVPAAVRLMGRLDAPALERALAEVVRRHETLRTTFAVVGDEPRQIIAPRVAFALPIEDLSTLGSDAREAEVRRRIEEEVNTGFDLSRGPLLRARLLRLSEEGHVLLFTLHHVVSDAWSTGVLIRELTALYGAFAAGRPSPLPELTLQYADFAAWQRERLDGAALERQLEYWRRQLGGTPPVLSLPTDRPRPAVQSYRGSMLTLRVSDAAFAGLRRLCLAERATLFMALHAVYLVLLQRYTGQQEFVVGTPVAGRDLPGVEGLIGFFVKTLALRTDASGNPTFRELLARVRETTLGAFANADVPFEKLVEELHPERDMSRAPLFQSMFTLQNVPPASVGEPGGMSVETLGVASVTAKFDVTLALSETATGLRGTLEYNSDIFEAATMERFAAHFSRLAEAAAADPDCLITTLPMLDASEREALISEHNETERSWPANETLPALFERQAAATPESVALVCGKERLTYAELSRRARLLAAHLRSLGVRREELVGVCASRRVELIIALLAVSEAGGAYLPLDPSYPTDRLSFMLEDARVRVLLTESGLQGTVPTNGAEVVCLDEFDWSGDVDASSRVGASTDARQLAYVIYTSGSTGRPKGVAIPHGALVNFLHTMREEPGLDAGDTLVAVTSLSFDIAALELFLPLTTGATLVLATRNEATSASRLARLLEESGATVMQATPATWQMLVESGWSPARAPKVLCGGEAFPSGLAAELCARSAEVWNMYGPTETTIWSACERVEPVRAHTTIGLPIANTQLYVLDGRLEPSPTGVAGELYIGGGGLARGYLNRPELTAERFVADPFGRSPGARMYRTGDVARRLADGRVEYLGRADEQVKIRGFRIELGEIEAALSTQPGVQQCVVVVREEPGKGAQLVAYVVASAGASMTPGELREAARERLPEYMLPVVVLLEELPLTPNGKVDKRALRALPLSGVTESREYVAPSNQTEELLAGVWARVLGVERVGARDNFFELGGHSLLATQVVAHVRQVFGVELALRLLFETPTVAGLAAQIERLAAEGEGAESAPLTRVARDSAPLSFAQQRLWFIDQLVGAKPLYHLPTAVRLRGRLDGAALERSLEEIVRRHETLRTTFGVVDGLPVQRISEEATFRLPVVDLSALTEPEREARVVSLTNEEARKPFDLERGPVMRAKLIRLGEEEHVLLFTLHHIASDGWSMGILIREMTALYGAFAEGRPSPLAELPIQYADFAVWQREWLRGEVLETQLAYWRERLGANVPALELPADRPHPDVPTHRGAIQTVVFPSALADELKALSRREGATLFMTLLAAFKSLLYRYSGQEEIVVGTDIANRRRKEVEGLIGFFVNQLVLRTSLAGDPTFRELLGRVRETALGAYAHQDLPFDKLVQALAPERELSRAPLYQAKLVLQNTARESLSLPGLTMSFVEAESGTVPFDFLLAMSDGSAGLVAQLSYSTDLFDAETVARLLERFRGLLEQVVANPDERLSNLRLLTESEAEGLAPEDFPDADLSQKDFENLLLALGDA